MKDEVLHEVKKEVEKMLEQSSSGHAAMLNGFPV
jgi:hypothetical protein